MRTLGGILLFLAMVALGILIYGNCTDQTFVEVLTSIWNAIASTKPTTTPAEGEAVKAVIGYLG